MSWRKSKKRRLIFVPPGVNGLKNDAEVPYFEADLMVGSQFCLLSVCPAQVCLGHFVGQSLKYFVLFLKGSLKPTEKLNIT